MHKQIVLVLSLFIATLVSAQVDVVKTANQAVDGHQLRIDKYDGRANDTVKLLSPLQTQEATHLYLQTVDDIQKNINNNSNYTPLDTEKKVERLGDICLKRWTNPIFICIPRFNLIST